MNTQVTGGLAAAGRHTNSQEGKNSAEVASPTLSGVALLLWLGDCLMLLLLLKNK